ncbi:baseplate assembly protein v [Bacillus sp. OxB-1]|uniref:phage baseplate assembly protein V n=1 Tax=Bacillus sp. (strain OxB-1) TaxID=98228 RepID=UPI0005820B99|nr:phage baseplate assembly protein V [Bacillus sp. OxB-1]BAQ11440.1 baseplate assembly protein v [Bacillus sp. OxB-1]
MRAQVGEVVSIDPVNATARVRLEEQDDKVSAPLRVGHNWTLKNKRYSLPKIGEHVLCIFTKRSEGFIVCALYSEETPPPRNKQEKHYIEFEDGSNIEYDTNTHTLLVNIVGDIHIQSGLGRVVTLDGRLLSNEGQLSPKSG